MTLKASNPHQVNKYTCKHNLISALHSIKGSFPEGPSGIKLRSPASHLLLPHPLFNRSSFPKPHMRNIYPACILSTKTSFGFYSGCNLHYPSLLFTSSPLFSLPSSFSPTPSVFITVPPSFSLSLSRSLSPSVRVSRVQRITLRSIQMLN